MRSMISRCIHVFLYPYQQERIDSKVIDKCFASFFKGVAISAYRDLTQGITHSKNQRSWSEDTASLSNHNPMPQK